ncbi:hypothetical protein BDP81DRAFT_105273 [Colletotrichum phormii]|uniref:Uncharacterized protein n=1 Tax=Colletotrichum phormii TaxID=359342 RepID=A0AAI9ZJB1_9PEZI|nr:uncharacterized protein BDP81DRAFT_105273 [Colletotrichum phormii]KAK1624610.1 hypothetical protein BDP81DRAFT_105273 [Colletotrichum phormii]
MLRWTWLGAPGSPYFIVLHSVTASRALPTEVPCAGIRFLINELRDLAVSTNDLAMAQTSVCALTIPTRPTCHTMALSPFEELIVRTLRYSSAPASTHDHIIYHGMGNPPHQPCQPHVPTFAFGPSCLPRQGSPSIDSTGQPNVIRRRNSVRRWAVSLPILRLGYHTHEATMAAPEPGPGNPPPTVHASPFTLSLARAHLQAFKSLEGPSPLTNTYDITTSSRPT